MDRTGSHALRSVSVLWLAAWVGCAPGAAEPLATTSSAAVACVTTELTASRTYTPAKSFPQSRMLSRPAVFAVPPSIEVVAGNAGDGVAVVTFSLGGQVLTTCRYRGGATLTNPLDPDDLLAGRQYLFRRCSAGEQPGAFLSADEIKLSIQSGSDAAGTTTARLSLPEVGENCAPIGMLPAPPRDLASPTTFHDLVSFLYQPTETTTPVQLDVAQGVIKPERAAAIRGRVVDRDGVPVAQAAVTVLGHPEYGITYTRSDGVYDMVVNGGTSHTMKIDSYGFVTVTRAGLVDVGIWERFGLATLTPKLAGIPIKPGHKKWQTIAGPLVSDARGKRRSRIYIPKNTKYFSETGVGAPTEVAPADIFGMRVQELTTGADALTAMPASLPPSSAFTYAADLTLLKVGGDEVAHVTFENAEDNHVVLYVESFLSGPPTTPGGPPGRLPIAGNSMPIGTVDPATGKWVPEPSGQILKITAIAGDTVTVLASDPVALPPDEQAMLASRYSVGDEVWRAPLSHFTQPDLNVAGADDFAPEPEPDDPLAAVMDNPDCESGSVIECQNGIIGHQIPISGTGMGLVHRSDHDTLWLQENEVEIAVTPPTLPESIDRVKAIHLDLDIMGQRVSEVWKCTKVPCSSTLANIKYKFRWNQRDGDGRPVNGRARLRYSVTYDVAAVYMTAKQFASNVAAKYSGKGGGGGGGGGGGTVNLLVRPAKTSLLRPDTVGLQRTGYFWLGRYEWQHEGLGGFRLSEHHAYNAGVVYKGTGERIEATSLGARTASLIWRGSGAFVNVPTGVAVTKSAAFLSHPHLGLHLIPYTKVNEVIARGYPLSNVELAAFALPSLPFEAANLRAVAADPDGVLFVLVSNGDFGRIWRRAADGTWTVFAGGTDPTKAVDGLPAVETRLVAPTAIAVDTAGFLYVADTVFASQSIVRKVSTKEASQTFTRAFGRLEGDAYEPGTTFGTVSCSADAECGSGFCQAGLCAEVGSDPVVRRPIAAIAIGDDGELFVATKGDETSGNAIYRVAHDGRLRRHAGAGACTSGADGFALGSTAFPFCRGAAMATLGRGGLLVAGGGEPLFRAPNQVKLLGATNIVVPFAGAKELSDSTPASAAGNAFPFESIRGLAVEGTADDKGTILWVMDSIKGLVRISSALPSPGASGIQIVDGQAGELYQFDSAGFHLATLDSATLKTVYTFHYAKYPAPTGGSRTLLTKVVDTNGNETAIERAADGHATAIRGPFGQTTVLQVDGLVPPGVATSVEALTRVTDPNGAFHVLGYKLGAYSEPTTPEPLPTLTTVVRSGLVGFTPPGKTVHVVELDDLGRLLKESQTAESGAFWALTPRVVTKVKSETPPYWSVTTGIQSALGHPRSFEMRRLTDSRTIRFTRHADGTEVRRDITAGQIESTFSPDGTTLSLSAIPDPRYGGQAPLQRVSFLAVPGIKPLVLTATPKRTLLPEDRPFAPTSITDEVKLEATGETPKTVKSVTTFAIDGTYAVTTTSAAGRKVTRSFDAFGRLRRVHLPTSGSAMPTLNDVVYDYDTRGRLTTVTTGTGTDARITSLAFRAADGFLDRVTDPGLNVTQFADYDLVGNAKTILSPEGTSKLTYSASRLVTTLSPPGRPDHTFDWDSLDRPFTYTAPTPAPGSTISLQTKTLFDAESDPTSTTTPDATVEPKKDVAGRFQGIVDSKGPGFRVEYQPATAGGRVSSLVVPWAPSSPEVNRITFGYAGAWLQSQTWTGAVNGSITRTPDGWLRTRELSVAGGVTTYGYDDDGLLVSASEGTVERLRLTRNTANGFVEAASIAGVVDAWTYNAFGEPTTYQAATPGSGSLFRYDVEPAGAPRDKLGRMVERAESIVQPSTGLLETRRYKYEYEAGGALKKVYLDGTLIREYSTGANGNRATAWSASTGTVFYTVDDQDRLTAAGGVSFTYTDGGNLATRTEAGVVTSFTYDGFGRLTGVSKPGLSVEYVLDAVGRPIVRKVNGAVRAKYLWDGALRLVAELDASDVLVARYVYGTRLNVPDYVVRGSSTYRVIVDHLGSPRLVVATDGTVVQRTDYDEFGVAADVKLPSGWILPFGFGGGLFDRDTSLVRLGARHYDPRVGRWISKDPAGFGGGLNLYRYANGDPVDYVDIDGHAAGPWAIILIAGAISVGFASDTHFDAAPLLTVIPVGRAVECLAGVVGRALARRVPWGAGAWPAARPFFNSNWKSVPTWQHTFLRHGQGPSTTRSLLGRAAKTGEAQGQWLNNEAAAEFLAAHRPYIQGPSSVALPPGMGQVVLPNGAIVPAGHATLIPNSSGGFVTAFPIP